ncbi:MAG: hypothetical protein KC496_07400 [Anaerolineae bacterium]|nr:hypothetical protein [Anaerolineae bacterium]
MPSEICWLIDNRVVLIRDYGVYTTEELKAGLEVLRGYLDSGTAPVYIVQDSRELEKYPTSLHALQSLMQPHPHVEHIIYILNPRRPGTRFMTSLLTRFSGKDFSNVYSLEEALKLIQQIDSTVKADELLIDHRE